MQSKALIRRRRRAEIDRLDDAELAQVVQELGPDGMAALVSEVGLADAGHWLALATPAQVLEVLDAELWAAPAGENERFDPRGFATWLEALVEVGPEIAADRLADMPQELAVVGLYRQALVFDADELWLAVARGLMDPAIDDQPQLEVGEYLLVGRGLDGWDAVVAAVLELADRHPEIAAALLDQCRELTDRAVGESSLSEALLDEGGEEEAALEREDRRARRGFVAPHAARSFLALAVEVDLETQVAYGGRDPVTAAYFRDWDRASAPSGPESAGLLRSGVGGARPEELGYLVQVVMAACETGGRRFTVEEAAEAVLAVCRVGEAAVGPAGTADALFRYGYHVLHARVVRRARELGDRTGLAESIPRLDGRFIESLEDLSAAESRLAAGKPAVEVEGVVERDHPELPRSFAVPSAAAAALGATGTTLVACRIGETERLRTLKPWDAQRWLVELPEDWCREARIEVGDRVTLRMELADEGVPEELAAALAADPELRARWHALPESRQRKWAEHVRGGRRAESRERRVAIVVARLRS